MRKLHLGVLFLLAGLMLSVLVACGGETPTATPVPTSTPAPPTNTVPPPSPTTPPATPTSAAKPAAAADVTLITDAITATNQLKSYHAVIEGTAMTESVKLEGDFVAPDKAYIKGSSNNQQIEEIATGGKTYSKDASGKWIILSDTSSSSGSGMNIDLTNDTNLLGSLAPLLAGGTQYMDKGTETMNGVQTRHFSATVDAAALLSGTSGGAMAGGASMSLGTFDVWIDPSTKYVHKLVMNLDLAPFMRLMMGMFGGLAGTPGPGTPTPTPLPATMAFNVTVLVSKHNDPSITIPNPPADAVPAPTNTVSPVEATMAAAAGMDATATAVAAEMAAPTATSAGGSAAATPISGGGGSTGATHKIGETATVAGLKITVTGIKDVAGTTGFEPSDGKKFVAVDVTIENPSDKDATVSSTLEMPLNDSAGNEYSFGISAQLATGSDPFEGTVPAKGKKSGPVAYEIPTDAKGLTWTFKDFVTDDAATWDLGQ